MKLTSDGLLVKISHYIIGCAQSSHLQSLTKFDSRLEL